MRLFFNWIDILCLTFLSIGSYVGYRKELTFQIFHLTGVVVSLFFALHNYQSLSGFLAKYCFLPSAVARIISFLVLIVTVIVVFRIGAVFIQKIIKIKVIEKLDKIGGVILGLVRYLIIVSLILICLLLIPWSYLRVSINERSVLGRHVVKVAPAVYSGLVRIFPAYRHVGIGQVLEQITEED